MLTKPMLLDETAQKILAAIQRIKNKLLGTSSTAVTPGSAGTSGAEPVVQDDTGRTIISALNDLGDAVPAETQYLSGVTGNIQTQLDGKVSDVQMAGTSIVSEGVANIPDASAAGRGMVNTGAQTFGGAKTFQTPVTVKSNSAYAGIDLYTNDSLRAAEITAQASSNWTRAYIQHFADSGSYRDAYFLPWKDPSDTANHDYNILTTKGIDSAVPVGNWTHGYAGSSQYQFKEAGIVITEGHKWTQVPDVTLTAPVAGLYAIQATALFNYTQPEGILIISRSASSNYIDYIAITDKTDINIAGTTQRIHTSCVKEMSAGDVAIVYVKFMYMHANPNYVSLRMFLL